MKIKKIRLIDMPKEEFSLNHNDMSQLIGGSNFNCPGTYQDGGWFGNDYCSSSYSNGECGSASDYCSSYTSCTFNLS